MIRSIGRILRIPKKSEEDEFFRGIDMFFEGRGEVHQTMKRLVKRLERANISYVVVGGMAINAHGYERMTKDVDVLLTRDGLTEFRHLFVPKYYATVPNLPRRFVDAKNDRTVDILVAGLFPGSGKPGPIAFPDPSSVRHRIKTIQYVNLTTLIQLKLAARRHRDFGDVVELVRFNELDESFAKELHPSVRRDFIECLEEKRREDEYLARDD
jgi:hypothetical protein